MTDQPQTRYMIHAGDGTPRWAFTYGISSPDAARRYYAEITGAPLASVILDAGEPTRDAALANREADRRDA